MADVLRLPAIRVWVLLVALTCASFWIGADHGLGSGDAALAAVLVVAFAKTWLVLRYFMEMHAAPAALRRGADAWVAVSAAVILVLFLR